MFYASTKKKESALIENMRVCYCDEKSGNVLVLCANLDGFCQDNYLVTIYIPFKDSAKGRIRCGKAGSAGNALLDCAKNIVVRHWKKGLV